MLPFVNIFPIYFCDLVVMVEFLSFFIPYPVMYQGEAYESNILVNQNDRMLAISLESITKCYLFSKISLKIRIFVVNLLFSFGDGLINFTSGDGLVDKSLLV